MKKFFKALADIISALYELSMSNTESPMERSVRMNGTDKL